jgi:2-hydroxycyclohexanecarboxyl-CoA dehydrogenase
MISFDRVVAVVTGSGSGIGRATTKCIAQLGGRVAAVDIDFAAAERTATSAAEDGFDVTPYYADVTESASVIDLARVVQRDLGSAEVLVNTVGWDIIEDFVDNTPEYWERVVSLNLMAPIRVTRAFLDGMVTRGQGSIVNVSSDAGRVGSSGETVYAGAKGGVIAFTKSLAREMARHNIRVNCICPGPTDTPLFRSQPEKMQRALERAIPLRRLAQPSEVADAIAYLASSRASFITGQVLSVSGGLTMAG